ncbi:nitrous oxide reductase accessory protein NosL [Rhodobacter sp. CZR27]|uniref:nitrous oxide reductase accessory protein NosL n=1 Tax=Rhodobacter sp. CZR27 TaxID=2033869 RepID=UPI000BBE7A38|nr:nitrous oxide reductase accessory protein NosL [Rhodobacter sp. CZR27]
MKRMLLAVLLLSACREEAVLPDPVALTPEAVGHYCQMNLLEHPGPKAQVHLKGIEAPLFFSQVRDAIAYQRMPEQAAEIAAVYVNDVGTAPSWDRAGQAGWVAAEAAFYVVGSDRSGGMGAPEFVPFADRSEADRFAAKHGGRVAELASVGDAEVLAPVEVDAGSEADFADSLRRLSQKE